MSILQLNIPPSEPGCAESMTTDPLEDIPHLYGETEDDPRQVTPPNFWQTVLILLAATRRRTRGRRNRQQELLNQRTKGNGTDWGGIGLLFSVLFSLLLNSFAAFLLVSTVQKVQEAPPLQSVQPIAAGTLQVSYLFLTRVQVCESWDRLLNNSHPTDAVQQQWITFQQQQRKARQLLENAYATEAKEIAGREGGNADEIEQRLRSHVATHGSTGLSARPGSEYGLASPHSRGSSSGSHRAHSGLRGISRAGSLPALIGSVLLLWWLVMLVCQGEGLELDLQRGRHPMWEWLLSHPVPPGAVFFAEMMGPIAANSIYWTAPVFPAILYGIVYGPLIGLLAFFLIGIPITFAAAGLGKSLEIGILLRFPVRTRGALLGLMSWLGYSSMMLMLIGIAFLPDLLARITGYLQVLTAIQWPWLQLFLGELGERPSFVNGLAACWMLTLFLIAGSIGFCLWGASQGLSGNAGSAKVKRARSGAGNFGLAGRRWFDPLYRKELLWFLRDRGAVVQAVLIPVTAAGFQLFNLRGLLVHAGDAWNYFCGAGILFGTYFLLILGPRSLASEGQALWISLTWPRGLESLLKAKAWLWSMVSTAIVMLIFVAAAIRFPGEIWKIALVGVGWYFFSRSMAEKSVTLVTVVSESGEAQRVPSGRRWATQLGMLTFTIGIMSRQWQVAFVGIIYSLMTSAAMWQNFRARLPYLYDPWSEEQPKPPTLMNAMIAVSVMVELSAVLMGILLFTLGRNEADWARALSYSIAAVVASALTINYLNDRDVSLRDVCLWIPPPHQDEDVQQQPVSISRQISELVAWTPTLGLGILAGAILGSFGRIYQFELQHIPRIGEQLAAAHRQMHQNLGAQGALFVMAVFFAPLAEEYLFRGLLYKALDREWGGWRAILLSAAFFASYHPPLAWLPVALLGATNSWLFKKTGSLVPAILTHMIYNAVVML